MSLFFLSPTESVMETLGLDGEMLPIGTTKLHIAANSGQTEGVLALLDRNSSLIDCLDQYGRTPLVLALQNGRMEAAQILIKRGAKLDVKFQDDGTTVIAALANSSVFHPLLRHLVAASVALSCELSSLLPIVSYEGNTELLYSLLNGYQVDVDYKDNLQCTALHYASQNGFAEIVRALLMNGASKTIRNSWGTTPLHVACSAGHLEVTKSLLEFDSSPASTKNVLNCKNKAGYTPVMCAFSNKQIELALYILETQLEYIDLQTKNCGHSLSGFCFYLRFIAKPSAITAQFRSTFPCLSSEEAQWLLHEGICANDTVAITYAVAQGASIKFLDFMQHTPLILASKLGHVEACQCLFENGAEVQQVDQAGKTPLVHAVEHRRDKVVTYLLSKLSLWSVDPNFFTKPLSSSILEMFVSNFKENECRDQSLDWLAWLTLAVPTANVSIFSDLVSIIAPSNWIQRILANNSSDTHSTLKTKWVVRYPTLPIYVKEVLNEPHKPRPKLVRSISEPRNWPYAIAARPPPSTVTQWTFQCVPPQKRAPVTLKNKHKPGKATGKSKTSRAAKKSKQKAVATKTSFSSLMHKAALHNVHILKYILLQNIDPKIQAELLLLKDEMGRTVLELFLPHFTLTAEAVEFLQLSKYEALDQFLSETYSLPESVGFEEALVQYLCIGEC